MTTPTIPPPSDRFPQTANYWSRQSRDAQRGGRMGVAIAAMEQAYNHVLNWAYAEQAKANAAEARVAALEANEAAVKEQNAMLQDLYGRVCRNIAAMEKERDAVKELLRPVLGDRVDGMTLADYHPKDVEVELAEELRCIVAARKLAMMPKLTAADADKARLAFESGLLPFVRQVVD